jgi:hypothetical protein
MDSKYNPSIEFSDQVSRLSLIPLVSGGKLYYLKCSRPHR